MNHLFKIFTEDTLLKAASARFKQTVYVYLILRCCDWLIGYDLLFGNHAVAYATFQNIDGFKNLAFILLNNHSTNISFYFLFALLLLCLTNLFFKNTRPVFDFVIWIIVLNLHNKIYSSITGGDLLLNQLLFFNVFLLFPFTYFSKRIEFIPRIIHNGSVIAIILQICLVYFIAGLAKLFNADWQNGSALIIISQLEQFKLIAIPGQSNLSCFVLTALSYLTLIYQLFFPLLVFIPKIKKPVLIFGIAMHLYIMLFMGLFWFGLIMIITYIFFWPFKDPK